MWPFKKKPVAPVAIAQPPAPLQFTRCVWKIVLRKSVVELTVRSSAPTTRKDITPVEYRAFVRWYFGRPQSQHYLLRVIDGEYLLVRADLQRFFLHFYKE